MVYVEENADKDVKKIEVVDPDSGDSTHMTFHCDASDAEAVAKVVEESH